MKLSIITVNLNNKSGLQKTIDSVISQTYKDFEWIIIDGGSTDGSKELIEKYSSYITYWVSEPDKGIYNAMNKGILVAKGEYLQFLNSGDALATPKILNDVFCANLVEDILYGNVIHIFNEEKQKMVKYNHPITLSYFTSGGIINHQAAFIKRDLFSNSLYNENLKIVSDWEFWIKQVLLDRKFKYIDMVIVFFDRNGLTSSITETQKQEHDIVISHLPEGIKADLSELYSLREIINDEYFNKFYYYSKKKIFKQFIIQIYSTIKIYNHIINKICSK